MLSQADNDLMCRVENGAPMGAMFREYWWPVLRAARLEPDGEVVRVRLLGERFVAYRATDGRLGFIDEGCPHRGASMALARNEECGLRCIFHGWKVDVAGSIVDTPNEGRLSHPERMKVGSYPIQEAGGMVWVYIGGGDPPPFPLFPFNTVEPDVQVRAVGAEFECNWMQLLETLWDPSHVLVLHGSGGNLQKAWEKGGDELGVLSALPTVGARCHAQDEPYGFRFKFGEAAAPAEGPDVAWRPTVMPTWFFPPALGRDDESDRLVFVHVPMDDTHTLLWEIAYNPVRPLTTLGQLQVESETPDNWRPAALSPSNNWGQDREAMKRGSFTGIGEGAGVRGLLAQDIAVAESMGGLADRTKERLGSADAGIVRGRRMFLEAVRAHAAGGGALGSHEDVSSIGIPGGRETQPASPVATP